MPRSIYFEIGPTLSWHYLRFANGVVGEEYTTSSIRLGMGYMFSFSRINLDFKVYAFDYAELEFHREGWAQPLESKNTVDEFSEFMTIGLNFFP